MRFLLILGVISLIAVSIHGWKITDSDTPFIIAHIYNAAFLILLYLEAVK